MESEKEMVLYCQTCHRSAACSGDDIGKMWQNEILIDTESKFGTFSSDQNVDFRQKTTKSAISRNTFSHQKMVTKHESDTF